MEYAINDITVSTQRKRLLVNEKVNELAESIREIGLLQPIVITSLLFGARTINQLKCWLCTRHHYNQSKEGQRWKTCVG